MRKSKSIIRILFILAVVVGIPLILSAQVYSEKREQGKSFKLKSGTSIQISNKYGNVNVLPWEKDSVRIDVSITAQSKQASKVVKILSTIDCEMMTTANSISARTVFYDNSATFWRDVVSYAGQVLNTSNNLQINYTVYMPVTNAIKIENKFGNVYMDSHSGNADITVSNGDLQARNFSGGLKLNIEFGSASFQDAGDAELNINYSDLTARKINKLNLDSRSSTLDIEETGVIEMTSSRDKLNVKSCNSLSGEASFSRIRINGLEAMCTMNTKYGELKLNNINRDFRNINIRSEYTDISLGLNPSDSYSLDLVYDSKTNLNISAPINNQLKKETLNAKSGTIHASGNIGKSSTSLVSVIAKSGSLSVMNK